jgi:hypothetical protein
MSEYLIAVEARNVSGRYAPDHARIDMDRTPPPQAEKLIGLIEHVFFQRPCSDWYAEQVCKPARAVWTIYDVQLIKDGEVMYRRLIEDAEMIRCEAVFLGHVFAMSYKAREDAACYTLPA